MSHMQTLCDFLQDCLLLYWATMVPLSQVFDDLPDQKPSFPMNLRVKVPTKGWATPPTLPQLLEASVESDFETVCWQRSNIDQLFRLNSDQGR